MNRWQGWARQLRGRHGRRDGLRARGAMLPMVLLQRHRGGMGSQVLVTAWRPLVQVHARFGVVRPVVMPSLPVMRERAGALPLALGASSWRRKGDEVSRSVPFADNVRQLAYPMPRFAAPTDAHSPRRSAPEQFPRRALAPLLESEPRLRGAPPVAAQAVELATRLRRRATREELTLSHKPAVLAAAQRAPAQPAPAASNPWGAAQPSPPRQEESRALPPAAALDVDALTGLVIQQIDRRLIAYRERMGRV